jgi:hypothetical protein
MTWRLTGDEDSRGMGTSIHYLMLLAWRDLDSFACLKKKVVVIDFEGQLSLEDEEELARAGVGVTDLAGAGRHELFDNAELGVFDEVPAVAVGSLWASPLVVLGRFDVDWRHRRPFL